MSTPALHSLVYLSSATQLFEPEQIQALLEDARTRNASRGLTGMLLYCEGNFMQVLEGPADDVRAVYARIARDPRHHTLIKLVEERVHERSFGDWSMAYSHATAPEFLAITHAQWQVTDPKTLSRGKKMLREFWLACRPM